MYDTERKRVKEVDQTFFNLRVERLAEIGVKSILPAIEKEHVDKIMRASEENRMKEYFLLMSIHYYIQEAKMSYIYGRFLSTILMSAMSIESALIALLDELGVDTVRLTFGNLIKCAKYKDVLEEQILEKVSKLNTMRNEIAHLTRLKRKMKQTGKGKITGFDPMTIFGCENLGVSPNIIREGLSKKSARKALSLAEEVMSHIYAIWARETGTPSTS